LPALFLLPFPYLIQHELVLNTHTANQFSGLKHKYYCTINHKNCTLFFVCI
jgi:hypothetical protein